MVTTFAMQSPLPDSSTLEAGILEDDIVPSRLSRVQDNVRILLRTSFFASVHSSPVAAGHDGVTGQEEHRTPLQSPRFSRHSLAATHLSILLRNDTRLPLPEQDANEPCGVLFPPSRPELPVFEWRDHAMASINHPEISHPPPSQQQRKKNSRQPRGAWTRSRCGRGQRRHGGASRSQRLICVLAGLLLATLLATYLSLALTWPNVSPTFHILFILAILLVTVILAHSLIHLVFVARSTTRSTKPRPILDVPIRRRRAHRTTHREPKVPDDADAFMPATPIRVHIAIDESTPAPNMNSTVADASNSDALDQAPRPIANPPPAYGRWRGSVRANPDLLHWQPQLSPACDIAPGEPSPTYREREPAVGSTSPPSYATNLGNTPARRREMCEATTGLARAQVAEPEMVEINAFGLPL